MLTAIHKDRKISMLDGWKREQITEMNKESFTCPICSCIVIPKLGSKKMWHFAHKDNEDCKDDSEKESYYHLLGKKQLFRWLKDLGNEAELEAYLPQAKQRADVLIIGKAAIEFQCATISEELVVKRSNGYMSERLPVYWILADKRVRRLKENVFKVSSYDLAMMGGRERLIFFCPLSMVFRTLSNIRPLSATKIFAQEKIIPLKKMDIAALNDVSIQEDNNKEFTALWLSEKKKWRLHSFQYHSSAYRYVKKIFSMHSHSLVNFPTICGVPSNEYFHIHTPSFLWQSWVCFYIQSCAPFTRDELASAFIRLVDNRVFSIRVFPFLHGSYKSALFNYVNDLQRMGWLRETDGYYSRLQPFQFHRSTLKALEEDERLSEEGSNFSLE
ncbi:competence protein CoiA [Fictibacillus aquaticus]|uniref:Competence protein CoiA n=1 Tax=Fictibacillus aquaticus TaxID=2021314 RepID=A0A235FCQ3_9BACL|nr:competence protein CoiA family protein [Fictibacillus aquaticus]OYD59061.1 hypothetical protein CGZ90_03930 [Fictibacillus aquaticus]